MKIDNFISRTLTSIGAVALLALVWIFFPEKGMTLLVFVIMAGLIWEYDRLVFDRDFDLRFRLFFLFFCLFSFWLVLFQKENKIELFLSFLFLFFILAFWILQRKKREDIFHGLCFGMIGLLYIVFPSILFLTVFLNKENSGPVLLFLSLCIVFLGDIFAYLGGQIWGKKKWMPSISPGKTWSGLFCGLFMSAISAVGFGFYIKMYLMCHGQNCLPIWNEPLNFASSFSLFIICFLFGALVFFIAQTGDLFVSLLKRQAGVKNSGRLLPGHGGLLDRLDGVLLALPFVYCVLYTVNYTYF